jgi:uncharacterized membrane protein YhhN
MKRLDIAILLSALAAIAGAWFGGDALWLHYAAKPLATVLILWRAAAVAPAIGPRYRRAVLAGMALSLVGDVLLMLPADLFVPGLIAFLLAHIGYVVAFAPGSTWTARAIGFGVLAVVLAINLAGLLPHIAPALKGAVLAYVVVLAAMAAFALARAWTPALMRTWPRATRFVAFGAVCFVASDSLLAWDRFGGGIPLAPLAILSTYWIAQWCIARSVEAR